jgi:spermidine synthase
LSARFEEIDRRATPMGEISLRRRLHPTLLIDVYEVKLGDEHLMSTLFTESETQLAHLALAATAEPGLDVVVGGLGLGYTARAVLADSRVRTLHVVEALGAVIDWHEQEMVPLAAQLRSDPRCHVVEGDFFALAGAGFTSADGTTLRPHAVLVDIDHTPSHVLHPSHAAFYTPAGLSRLAEQLGPGGVFALWSDDAPDATFLTRMGDVFATCEAHIVTFPNPLTDGEASNTVYVARTASA